MAYKDCDYYTTLIAVMPSPKQGFIQRGGEVGALGSPPPSPLPLPIPKDY